jgi:hypothetical protein
MSDKKEIGKIRVDQYRFGYRSRGKQLPAEIPAWAKDIFLMFEDKMNEVIERINNGKA